MHGSSRLMSLMNRRTGAMCVRLENGIPKATAYSMFKWDGAIRQRRMLSVAERLANAVSRQQIHMTKEDSWGGHKYPDSGCCTSGSGIACIPGIVGVSYIARTIGYTLILIGHPNTPFVEYCIDVKILPGDKTKQIHGVLREYAGRRWPH